MDRRQNNGSVKAVSPRHCAATSALRNCCFNCSVTRTMSVALLLRNNPKRKKSTFAAQLHLPAHDLFWANLRVQLHLPPLDLAWNLVYKLSMAASVLLFLYGVSLGLRRRPLQVFVLSSVVAFIGNGSIRAAIFIRRYGCLNTCRKTSL